LRTRQIRKWQRQEKDNAEAQSSLSRRREPASSGQQDAKGCSCPSDKCEVFVQSWNVGGFKFVRQVNQAGIGLPSPTVPRFFLRSWLASRTRRLTGTTREGLQPNSRTGSVSLVRERSSSLAWIGSEMTFWLISKRREFIGAKPASTRATETCGLALPYFGKQATFYKS
jgi:hypothetical protein